MGETCFARLACGHAHICLAGLTREKSSKIHYCIGSLNVEVVPRVQFFSAFHFSCIKIIWLVGLQEQICECTCLNYTNIICIILKK